MGRLVKPTRIVQPPARPDRAREEGVEGAAGGAGQTAQAPAVHSGDGYLERVAKYIPSEIVAFFLFVNNILVGATAPAGGASTAGAAAPAGATMAGFQVTTIGVWIFVLAWVFTPIYLYRMREPGDAWKLNALLGTALFPVWAYSVQGVGVTHWVPFDGDFASILLGVATVGSGGFQPKAADASEAPVPT